MTPAATETVRTGRRAERAEARREEILDAAERVFAEKGFHETGIADIAAELGIGHGTFYRYFDNKQDIAAQVLERAVMGIAKAGFSEDPESTNTLEDYRAQTTRIMTNMFEVLEQNPAAMQLFHAQAQGIDAQALQRSFEAYSEFTERFLVNGVEKGFLRAELDTEITAQALVGLIFEGTRRAVVEDTPRELWLRWIDAGVALMFDGVKV
ncbi:MAG: TetR/AcrR family transcriptional regulator [Solirubrobacterales bacterium]